LNDENSHRVYIKTSMLESKFLSTLCVMMLKTSTKKKQFIKMVSLWQRIFIIYVVLR